MSSILASNGLVLATAMVVSSTVIFLAFSKQKVFLPTQLSRNPNSQESNNKILRSCLYSEEKKRERKKMKKKVQFADNVKEPSGNGKEFRNKEHKRSKCIVVIRSCRNKIPEIHGIPGNRIALYNGILRDRVQRTGCSY
ncbi:Cytochrome P450 family protein [Quillaja saponaria]|uniref:Cytochrome P450 family protein n=1 Tax=Quillaja saponaria TaxID=32244 RepID=A0AAD7PE94_QUISA|nr:Cytochrome P450 family protein [Quillaja saponaria]